MNFRGRGILLSYDSLTGTFTGQVVGSDRVAFGQMYQGIPQGKVCALEVGRWYPKKSTGPESQNNHFWGHVRQIAQEIGEDVEAYAASVLLRAEKRGYPVVVDPFGGRVPKLWREASSAEAARGIEQTHEDASFLGLLLTEREWEHST